MSSVPLRRSCRRKAPDPESSGASLTPSASGDVPEAVLSSTTASGNASSTSVTDAKCSNKRLKMHPHSLSQAEQVTSGCTFLPDLVSSNISAVKIETAKILRPTPAECEYVSEALEKLHPEAVRAHRESRRKESQYRGDDMEGSCGYRREVLDGVVATMLSQNTTDANSRKAFSNLKRDFPSWEDIFKLDSPAPIAISIKVAGLSETRSQRIYDICQTLHKERGLPISMNYLRDIADNNDVKKELSRFKGLGPKTISCVLLFTLQRDDFPVDTHVWRIAQSRLGWAPKSFSREDTYQYLNEIIPDEHKLPLHCLLVTHGKHCHACAARGRPQFPPKDGTKLECPLGQDTLRKVFEKPLDMTVASSNGFQTMKTEIKVETKSTLLDKNK